VAAIGHGHGGQGAEEGPRRRYRLSSPALRFRLPSDFVCPQNHDVSVFILRLFSDFHVACFPSVETAANAAALCTQVLLKGIIFGRVAPVDGSEDYETS
jgi:hypothetical protein